jgi:glycosyltransferase involved in cell wall biosynthesis
MPAYNEAENLARLLPTMPTRIEGMPVVVLLVNDGSTDSSAEVAQRHGAFVVSSPVNRGQGAALRLGYDVVARLNLEGVAISMDADGQHQAEDISGLISPILSDHADFVIGSRCLGDRERDSAIRYLGIQVNNRIISILTGYKITDCSSGFRAFNLKMLRNLSLKQNQFVAPEIIIDAAKKQYRILECPITVTKRFAGTSKKGTTWHYGFNFLRSTIKTWLR